MNLALSVDTGDISQPIELRSQLTFVAFGLQTGEEVTFEVVLLSTPITPTCQCPPGQVVLPDVIQSFPLTCCEEPIVLTAERPYVVVDAPQGFLIRARWDVLPTQGQVVYYQETNTPNLTDCLRGCALQREAE